MTSIGSALLKGLNIAQDKPAQTEKPAATESGDGKLKVGTYNLAAGNEKKSIGFRATTEALAKQVVDGGTDVVALQEVDVGTDRASADMEGTGFDDYNEYALAQVSAQEAGLQEPYSFQGECGVDSKGNPTTTYTGTDAEGRTSKVTISKEYYDAEGGAPVSADEAEVTVYNADVKSSDGTIKDYTVVYGSSKSEQGGTYGNSVLLGPNASVQRDGDGNAMVTRHDLDKDNVGGENRTAIEVKIEAAGEQATVISAHLSADSDNEEARAIEYAKLAEIAEKSGDNTILLGDFNTGDTETVGPLTGENDDENYAPWTPKDPIDRIYVSNDVSAENREHVEGGGSDHNMLTWDVDLDG